MFVLHLCAMQKLCIIIENTIYFFVFVICDFSSSFCLAEQAFNWLPLRFPWNIFLYPFVLMYSCTHVLMSSCPHVLLYSCPHVLTSSCPHVLMFSCTHVLMSSCSHVLMSSCTHVLMCSCPYVLMQLINWTLLLPQPFTNTLLMCAHTCVWQRLQQ